MRAEDAMLSADPAYDSVPPAEPDSVGTRIAGRYDVIAEIGRGGMASVLHVVETATGQAFALKRLLPQRSAKLSAQSATLLEREYHTLAQLRHPGVIQVYEYGLDAFGPYYTMELLDGGDLRELSPLPWRKACEVIFDVCSALSLLHSRHLVHRDISPRNIRCTQSGQPKLIDFGAMVPMGSRAQLVGTPAFVAPEVVLGSALDARTDLYSLGATMYYALTGSLAFPARGFNDLYELWASKPPPPSAFEPGVPASLDRLVSSLISREPALRPRSVHEVSQRLQTLAGIDRPALASESQAYLVMPSLVGRDEVLTAIKRALQHARRGHGAAYLLTGPEGVGRSRALEACALEAKLLGATVTRVMAGAEQPGDFAVAHTLAANLLDTAPEITVEAARDAGSYELLFELPAAADGGERDRKAAPKLRSFARSPADRPALQAGLQRWLLAFSRRQALLIAVDDVQQADESSVALLAALCDQAQEHGLVVLASAPITRERYAGNPSSRALEALRSRCAPLALAALDLEQTQALLCSVFGDVPNLALLSARVYAIAHGKPRQTLVLAQHLVDRGVIRYEAGSWSLPQQLAAADLPATERGVIAARIEGLRPLARRLLYAQTLALHGMFSREDYQRLDPDAQPHALDEAIDELLGAGLVMAERGAYSLVNRPGLEAIAASLDSELKNTCHRMLGRLYSAGDRPAWQSVRQLLLAGDVEAAFARLMPILAVPRTAMEIPNVDGMSFSEIGRTLRSALRIAIDTGRSRREQFELRRWMMLASVSSAQDELFQEVAAELLVQLERDSGLAAWRELSAIADPGERLTQALQQALQLHAATPEAERAFPLEQAIRTLVEYVAVSIATCMRSLDVKVLGSLPALLEPFAPLSPILRAVWQNAIASYEASRDRAAERVIARWRSVYDELAEITTGDMDIVQDIRFASAYAIGNLEAAMGLPQAAAWVDVLERDSFQRLSAMYLRKVISLQQGDFEAAERYRKQAELLALQSNARQMFTTVLVLELGVHAAAWDLTGVKQIAERIEPLAARYPGWVPFRHLAEGHHRRLRGDLQGASSAYARCMALVDPTDPSVEQAIIAWPLAVSSYVEVLVALDRADEARACAERVLRECRARGMQSSCHDVERALALSQAKLGNYAEAAAMLEDLIARQRAIGIAGLNLGATYETRTRIAIWARDLQAVEQFGRLCAEQYRHGHGSPLGARYERLMDEARETGLMVAAAPSAFETAMLGQMASEVGDAARLKFVTDMSSVHGAQARAERALALLCEASQSEAGHLFVSNGRELRWVCSQGALSPPIDMQRRAQQFWQRNDSALDDSTMLTEAAADGGESAQQLWPDPLGMYFQPVLLRGRQAEQSLQVGVVLLSTRPGQQAWVPAGLMVESAKVLLQLRDTLAGD